PSNEDPRFDRVRARKMLTELSGLGMSAQILADTAARMAAARQVLGQAANRAAADLVHCALGQLTIAVADFWRLPDDTRWRLLSQALCTVSGNPYRPNLSALRGAEEALRAGRAHTLHGCYLTSGVALCVHREAAAISTLRSAAPGLWDGWKVTGPKVQNAEIRILGESGLAQTSDWRASGLPFRAALATPGIWHGDELLGSPALNLGEWTARTLWDKTSFTASLLSH
ncbi:MAG: tRNA lysidine(34) synthetase TilS, partial [Mangrovicoccus sp.]